MLFFAMSIIFDILQTVSDGIGNYLNSTRAFRYIYSSQPWNSMRMTMYGTYQVDEILSIGESCEYTSDDYYCKHLVRYKYNGIEQQEVLDAQQILRFCKQTDYPISEHFSVASLIRNNPQIHNMPDDE